MYSYLDPAPVDTVRFERSCTMSSMLYQFIGPTHLAAPERELEEGIRLFDTREYCYTITVASPLLEHGKT